jgi:short-subunit dehydrogenase involved in D-alanine esterification of teichoic acids
MEYRNTIILVTGGSSGIGRAFVDRFLREGATVVACSRDEAKLQGLKAQHPSVQIRPCDITSSDGQSADSVSHTGIRAARHLGE